MCRQEDIKWPNMIRAMSAKDFRGSCTLHLEHPTKKKAASFETAFIQSIIKTLFLLHKSYLCL